MIVAEKPWYADHLRPIAEHLPEDDSYALVAGYGDLVTARRRGYRRFVVAQHGAGQSYSNDHPHYPGGRDHGDVGLFLAPNEHSAQRWRRRYPDALVEVIGCPRVDVLPAKEPGPVTVAVAFHWDLMMVPETMSALPWFRLALPDLAAHFNVIGTGHPRRRDLAYVYAKAGIEYVPDFLEVCRRADVLAFDNTSVGFEFAATGRPVVLMDAPIYRKEAQHGLRFWDASTIGPQVDAPHSLRPAITRALEYRPEDIAAREDALETVYGYRYGAGKRAAEVIRSWAH